MECVTCPARSARLLEIIQNLRERITEARGNGWLGEVEGLQVSFGAAMAKLNSLKRAPTEGRPQLVDLGMLVLHRLRSTTSIGTLMRHRPRWERRAPTSCRVARGRGSLGGVPLGDGLSHLLDGSTQQGTVSVLGQVRGMFLGRTDVLGGSLEGPEPPVVADRSRRPEERRDAPERADR